MHIINLLFLGIYSKIDNKDFEIFLPFADKMAYLRYFNNPLLNKPLSNIETYKKFLKEAEKTPIQLLILILLKVLDMQLIKNGLIH